MLSDSANVPLEGLSWAGPLWSVLTSWKSVFLLVSASRMVLLGDCVEGMLIKVCFKLSVYRRLYQYGSFFELE